MDGQSHQSDNHTTSAKSRRRPRRRLLLIGLSILMLGLALVKLVPWSVSLAHHQNAQEQPEAEPELLDERFNLLVMGVDKRPDDVGRTDTLMVVSVNKTDAPRILSIPRDTRVQIPGRKGFTKINHAYVYGGPELTVNTVSEFLGIKIDGYVVVKLASCPDIIDAIGGVDIDVEKRMHYVDKEQGLTIDLQPGEQHLTGEQAMQYVRYRDSLGDEGRVQRQLKFVKALGQSAMSASNVLRLPSIIRTCYAGVDTNIGLSEALRIAATAMKTYDLGMNTNMLPGEGEYIDRVSYFVPNLEAMYELVATNFFSDNERQQYLSKIPELLRRYKV